MDFFNKVANKISTTSKDVASKAKDQAEIFSLNGQISSQEEIVKKTYGEIGKYVYENQKDGAPNEVAEKFAIIDAALTEIAGLKDQINKIKGVKNCPQCNAEVARGTAFCPDCGFKMPEDAPEQDVEGEAKEVVEAEQEAAEPVVESEAAAEPVAEETVNSEE